MPQRVIAIGDVHGCAVALRALVAAIQPTTDDTLIPLGDCIDRGLESRQVIDELLALRANCRLVPLLGNHEEMMLNFLDGRPQPDDWLDFGGAATLASYGPQRSVSDIPADHIDFIRGWADCFQTDTHFFVHGGYEAERPLTEQHWQIMRWHSLRMEIPGPHESGKKAVVGHTSLKNGEVLDLGHLICIDTYCWGGGWLTALDAASGQLWQADRQGRMRSA
ncbi:MAG: metallophosphoesterase [Pirellulales bacterium]